MAPRPGLFYGWVVVGVVAVVLATSSGARFAFGVFLRPIAEAHGWERAALSLAITINLVLGGLLQPLAGWLVDRVGARLVGALGIALLGLAFVGLAGANELWQVDLLYGVVGAVGVAATSTVLSAPLIGAWFVARRSTALSFSTSGNAIGQLVVVPLATWVLLAYGFASGFLAVGLGALLLVAPLAWLLLRDQPSDLGLAPDGEPGTEIEASESADGLGVDQAARHPVFWQLTFGLAVCGVTMSFPSTHLMPYAMDMHMPEMMAGSALGLAGGLSLPAAIAIGWLADRHGKGRLLALVYALRGVTYVVLLFATTEPMWFLAAFVLGLSWTGTVPLSAAIAADAFGRRNLGLISGVMVMGMWIAAGLAAYGAGLVYDQHHTYQPALVVSALLGGLAALVVWPIRAEVREGGAPHAAQVAPTSF